MKTIFINLSLKKSGTSFVHNLLSDAGFKTAPEKEYYIIPRNTEYFFSLIENIEQSLDADESSYFSSGVQRHLTAEDRECLRRIICSHGEHVARLRLAQIDPTLVIKQSFERLLFIASSYHSSNFVVSDPNCFLDLARLLSAPQVRPEFTGLRSLSFVPCFFSVVRHPIRTAVSLVAMHVQTGLNVNQINHQYLSTIAERTRFFSMLELVEQGLGVRSRLFRFDSVVLQPAEFVARLKSDVTAEAQPTRSIAVENPNPGIQIESQLEKELVNVFGEMLADEILRFNNASWEM